MNKYLIIALVFSLLITTESCKKRKMKQHCCEEPPFVVYFDGGYIGIANMFLAEEGTGLFFNYHVKGTKEFNFKIYNSKETLIFEANDTSEFWDGRYESEIQLGIVDYTLSAVTINNEKIQHSAQICLVDFENFFKKEGGVCFEYYYNCAFDDSWCDTISNDGDTLWYDNLKGFSCGGEISSTISNCN